MLFCFWVAVNAILIGFFPIPYSFNAMFKAHQLELWPFWMSGFPLTTHQIHIKSEMPNASKGISGINYFFQ